MGNALCSADSEQQYSSTGRRESSSGGSIPPPANGTKKRKESKTCRVEDGWMPVIKPGDPAKLHEVLANNRTAHPEHYVQGGVTGEVKLSEAELEELQEIFKMFDKDSSGSIDVHELETMVSSLGIKANNEELLEMIAEADIDENGTIEFNEFKTLIGPHFQKEKPPEDYIEAFKFFDKDGDGYISRAELRTIMNTVDGTIAESDIEDMVREADVNGDGKIDFEEFTKMMNLK